HHQAIGRNERGAAAAQRDHGAHRIAGEIGEAAGIDLQSHLLQLGAELRDLLRHPHAFVGGGACRKRGNENDQGFFHDVSLLAYSRNRLSTASPAALVPSEPPRSFVVSPASTAATTAASIDFASAAWPR